MRKRIAVGVKLLSQWQKGEINEVDVEVTLAHEIGHLMDFERKFRSVFFRYSAIAMLYFVLGAVLLIPILFLLVAVQLMPLLSVFILWAFFLPWILRRTQSTTQFEADKNASRLINGQQIANSFAKRTLYHPNGFEPIKTWRPLLDVIFHPSLSERLKNLNFEIKERKIEIQKIEPTQYSV